MQQDLRNVFKVLAVIYCGSGKERNEVFIEERVVISTYHHDLHSTCLLTHLGQPAQELECA